MLTHLNKANQDVCSFEKVYCGYNFGRFTEFIDFENIKIKLNRPPHAHL